MEAGEDLTKIVINSQHGGFGLSNEAVFWLIQKGSELVEEQTISQYTGGKGFETDKGLMSKYGGRTHPEYSKPFKEGYTTDGGIIEGVLIKDGMVYSTDDFDMNRDHPDLIEMVETLGKKANSQFAKLEIIEIPDDVEWHVEEYDGAEWIAEKHRTWPE